MAWKKHYFAKGISLDIKKECFATNVRETDFEVLIQESFLRIVKRNSVYEVTLSVADPGRGLALPRPPPLIFRQNRKRFFLFCWRLLSKGLKRHDKSELPGCQWEKCKFPPLWKLKSSAPSNPCPPLVKKITLIGYLRPRHQLKLPLDMV